MSEISDIHIAYPGDEYWGVCSLVNNVITCGIVKDDHTVQAMLERFGKELMTLGMLLVLAHEAGHILTNSTSEEDANKVMISVLKEVFNTDFNIKPSDKMLTGWLLSIEKYI